MLLELETSRFRRTTKWHVRRVLKWISQEDLKDLHAIRVIDDRPNDPEYAKRPRYLSGFLYNGSYEFKTKDRNARVVLCANDIGKAENPNASPLTEAERDWLLHGYDGNPKATLRQWRFNQTIEKGRRKKKRR